MLQELLYSFDNEVFAYLHADYTTFLHTVKVQGSYYLTNLGRRLLFSLKQCPAKIMQTNRRKPTSKVDRQHQKLGHSLSHLGEDVPSNVVFRFVISKKIDEKWGINVVGGKGSISHNIYVKDVQFGSVCARDGQLLNGDCVLEVNLCKERGGAKFLL